MTLAMTLRCPTCGSDQFLYPANPNLDTQVTCKSCGAVATVAQIADKEEAKRLVAENVAQTLADMAKRKP